jgi:hypothetical protein
MQPVNENDSEFATVQYSTVQNATTAAGKIGD